MKYSPKKINYAGIIVPAFLFVIGMLCFVGASYWGFPVTVFQLISLICFTIAILILSRYGLCDWEYALTEECEEYPYGRLQVVKCAGSRRTPYADLDLSFSVLFLSSQESKVQKKEKTLAPYQKSISVVKNMFARDVYELFIGFRAGNARLLLELNEELFFLELKRRVDRAIADDARNQKLRKMDEAQEEYDEYDEIVIDPADHLEQEEVSTETVEDPAQETDTEA